MKKIVLIILTIVIITGCELFQEIEAGVIKGLQN